MRKLTTAQRVSKNLIKKYGYEKFVSLIEMYQRGASMEEVAKEYGVTRQRAHQWMQALGTREVSYKPHDETKELLQGAYSVYHVQV